MPRMIFRVLGVVLGGVLGFGLGCSSDGPPKAEAWDEVRTVFVSSTTQNAALRGLSGADDLCISLAQAANLSGTYRAWLSSVAEPTGARFAHSDVPYVLPDGTKVADDWNDLVDGSLDAAIDINERGEPVTGDVWTGTLADGSPWLVDDCAGFTMGTGTQNAACGSAAAQSAAWTDHLRPACSTPLRIYCFEQ